MPAKQSRGQAKAKERKKTAGPKAAAKLCFVLMPFREPFGTYYERIYVPAIRGADLEPRRIDEVFRAGTIIKDIWDYTVGAQVLVAELTGRNPNVFYELGLAHAIAKPVVLVTQTIDDVPFDLKHLRHILYNTIDPDWATKLQEDLTRAIGETLADPAASLALPSAVSPVSLMGKEADEESEVMTLLKALDSKVDYMRRQPSPAVVFASHPPEWGGELSEFSTPRRRTSAASLARWLLDADERQLRSLYQALGGALRLDMPQADGGDEPEKKPPSDS